MRRVLPLIAVLSLAFAPAPFPRPVKQDAAKKDLQHMQGEWSRIFFSINGKVENENPDVGNAKVRKECLAFSDPTDRWKITLDVSKTPKRISCHRVDSKGESGDVFKGIYRLEGDTLIICHRLRKDEKDRPTSFDAEQPGVWLLVYKRKKP